jgi:septum formation protein
MTAAGYAFEVRVSDIDERLLDGETPREYVRRLAIEKAEAVSQMLMGPAEGQTGTNPAQAGHDDPNSAPDIDVNGAEPEVESGFRPYAADLVPGSSRTTPGRTNRDGSNVLILGADTAVVVDDEILGKPVDRADAERMLRRLSGRAHRVLTGVSIRLAARHVDAVDETLVFVRPLTDADVAWYVDSGEGQDKAGGYAIQGLASRFIPRIEGSYSNVVGLPVARVEELISELIKAVE